MLTLPQLTAQGHSLDTSEASFGSLASSESLLGQPEKLRQRLDEDGYLYIRGFFRREAVMRVRAFLTDQLALLGLLHPDHPTIDGVIAPDQKSNFQPKLAKNEVESLVYGPKLLAFYQNLLGGPVLHYDFTWLRVVAPGLGTPPHCDIVYMGRGTHNLLTCWVPYGDISLEVGGLIVLEQSHRKSALLQNYLSRDVDSYCENRPKEAKAAREGKSGWLGYLSNNPATLQQKLGGRWLTADWHAGDFITFKMNVVHGSLDNQTDRIRLSSDTRYQLANESVDERWIGPNPPGHDSAGKRGRIC